MASSSSSGSGEEEAWSHQGPDAGMGSQQQQAGLNGHYRRKKTNKAPRKRTFIANMTKYNSIETSALESASRGVGFGGAGGHIPGLGFSQGMLPAGEPGARAAAGGLGSHFPAPSSFQAPDWMASSTQADLPWDLANLPTMADSAVWGSKQAAPMQPHSAQQVRVPSSSSGLPGPFTELLTGPFTAEYQSLQDALFPNWNSAPAAGGRQPGSTAFEQAQNEYQAAVAAAAAAAAAMVVASSPSTGDSPAGTPRTGNSTQQLSLMAAPSGPPKVSFDLFPELAALARGPSPQHHNDISTGILPAAAHACFSRAVVTGVEGGRGMAGMIAFAAPSPTPLPARPRSPAPPVSSLVGATSTPQLLSSAPSMEQQQQHVMAQAKALMGSLHHSSSSSLASAASGTMVAMLPQVAAQVSAYSMAPATSMELTAAPSGPLMGGVSGRRSNAGGSQAGRGRGVKRAAAAAASAAASMVGGAGAAAAWAAAAAAPSATPGAPRTPPFVLPLHGMSVAGAVVPGGAGELRVTSLVSVGAYGLVYRGRWSERDVAVKMMRPPREGEGLSAQDVLRSFRRESDLLKRLAHPNIVALKHSQDVEPVCIVQDFAVNGTLSDYIHAPIPSNTYGHSALGAPLAPASDLERAVLRRLARRLALVPDSLIADLEARSVATTMLPSGGTSTHPNQRMLRRYLVLLCLLRDVASAFVYLAAPPGQALPPVVHRDVKPSNILLSVSGTALLADFGVAKVLSPASGQAPGARPAFPAPPSIVVPRLASAPLPDDVAAASEVASMFTVWSDDLASWGLAGPTDPAKRPRYSAPSGANPAGQAATRPAWESMPAAGTTTTAAGAVTAAAAAVAAGPHPTWDALPSADVDMDMSWLDSLLAGNIDDDGEGGMQAGGAAPAAPQVDDNAAPGKATAAGAGANDHASSGSSAANAVDTHHHVHVSGDEAGAEGGAVARVPSPPGTAHYAAPEDLCTRTTYALTPAADMFSLGYCIWEALTAARPWAGEQASDVVRGVGQAGARLPLPASFPPRLAGLVSRCWSTDPSLRPSPGQVMAELDAEIRTALGAGM